MARITNVCDWAKGQLKRESAQTQRHRFVHLYTRAKPIETVPALLLVSKFVVVLHCRRWCSEPITHAILAVCNMVMGRTRSAKRETIANATESQVIEY